MGRGRADDLREYYDREYLRDLSDLRREFAAVDTADPTSLRRWFSDHAYLANNDHARIARVCLRTVRRWKCTAGITPAARRPPPSGGTPRPTSPPAPSPADWRAGTWLEDQYRGGHGIRAIARTIHRSYTFTRRLLARRGVLFRPAREASRSGHPCSRRDWLVLHYVVRGLSLTWCARVAGVSKSTTTGWLVSAGMRVRSAGEQLAAQAALGPGHTGGKE